MKSSEKKLVGIAMAAGGIALFVAMGLPQWDVFTANTTKAGTLRDTLKSTQAMKDNLTVQVSLLEKNIDIPADIQVKTFTNDTEEQATKELLDHVINLATGVGNKFISLSPASVDPFLAPKPKAKDKDGKEIDPAAAEAASGASAEDTKAAMLAAAEANAPPLLTKGYELTVRGTYDTLQSFLRAMDKQTMILDMLNFDLENEAVDTSAPSDASAAFDPSFPLRLKVTLRLALQRVDSSNTPTK